MRLAVFFFGFLLVGLADAELEGDPVDSGSDAGTVVGCWVADGDGLAEASSLASDLAILVATILCILVKFGLPG